MKGIGKLLTGILIGAVLASVCVFLYMKDLYQTSFENQQLLIAKQAELADSIRNSTLPGLIGNVLNKIDADLKDNPQRKLSDETIDRITALCFIAKPYMTPEGDSLSTTKVSPERGQLLLFLSGMNIDSVSMQKIKQSASFAGADLREADLIGIDLSGINLKGANLKGANLQNANLTAANLSFANLWGTNLNKTNLKESNLKRVVLSWADMNESNLTGANLHEADLVSAQMRKAILRGAFLQWADFSGAFLNEADMANTDLFRATLKRAQLLKANMSGSIMTYAIISEANLIEANLSGSDLTNLIISEQHWLTLLNDWKVTGAKEIQSNYKIVEAFSYEGSKYQLNKLEQ